jgi:hypothetical protein
MEIIYRVIKISMLTAMNDGLMMRRFLKVKRLDCGEYKNS